MKYFIHAIAAAALLAASGCNGKPAPEQHAEHEEAGHESEEGHDEHAEERAHGASAGEVEVSVEAQKAGGIRTETLRRSGVAETFQALGRVMQDSQQTAHVAAGGAGKVAALNAAAGAAVEAGEELARILAADGTTVTVSAPRKGLVTAVHASEGDAVNELSFICTITEVDPLWGVLDIPERELQRVKQGQKADIRAAAYPGRKFSGTITFVSPEIDPVSRMVKARISIENPGGLLKFGMFLDAAVHSGGKGQGVAVRSDAIQNGPAGPFVFVKTDETCFVPTPVETGREADGMTEIKKGAGQGDKVVVEGAYLLKSEMMKAQLGEGGHDH